MPYLNPVDISNRGLQHIGAERIDASLGFSENSKNSSECAFVYDKLRVAELRANAWRFAIRRAVLRAIDTNTMLLAPAVWVSTTTYFVGSIVSDETGQLWISNQPNNLNNQPQNSYTWEEYFGPLTVSLYTSTLSYASGELVYTTAGAGASRVFLSLQNGNTDNPATATAWSATGVYSKNQVVTYLSVPYMSLIDLNTNQQPNLAPALWSAATTYSAGNSVGGSDGLIYTSIAGSNLNHDPTTTGGVYWTSAGVLNPWTTVFVGGSGSLKWLEIGGAEFPFGVGLSTMNITYPVGAGPSSQSSPLNVYRLPAGYLNKAAQNPKAGSVSYLGGPSGAPYLDWNYENNYLTSSEIGPIAFRFVADTVDVRRFDPMFCEGLAARIAQELCEPITQSSAKLNMVAALYKKVITDAKIVNGIETGPEEPAEDDLVACRA